MAVSIRRVLKEFFKGLGVFILGGVVGVAVLFVFFIEDVFAKVSTDIGLGIIALAPILVIFYSALYFIIGGVIGLVLYMAYRFCELLITWHLSVLRIMASCFNDGVAAIGGRAPISVGVDSGSSCPISTHCITSGLYTFPARIWHGKWLRQFIRNLTLARFQEVGFLAKKLNQRV